MSSAKKWVERRLPYLLILPALVCLLAVGLYPALYGMYLSVTRWSMFKPKVGAVFVGAQNYLTFIGDARAIGAVKNALVFTVGAVTPEFVLGLGIALLINRVGKGKDLITILLIMPMAMTPIIVGLVWKMLLDPVLGWIPYFFSLIGVTLPPLLALPQTAMATVIFVDVWQWTPFMILLLFAGLKSLPVEPYEAAQLDGASRWQTLRHITIPGLKPIIAVALAFRIIDSMNMLDVMYILTRGGPGTVTEPINYYAYLMGLSWGDITYSCAMAVVMLYLLVVISQGLLRVAKPERT